MKSKLSTDNSQIQSENHCVLTIFFRVFLKVASELNAAILKAEHADNTQPKVAVGLKLVLWAQNELDKKRIRYNRMVDLSTGRVEDSK